MTPFGGKYSTSYLMAIVIFAFSVSYRLLDIHKSRKCRDFDLENEGQNHGLEGQDLHRSTGTVRYYTGDYFQNFSYSATYIYAKSGHTHTHTHTHTALTGVLTVDKICKANLPKNDSISATSLCS